MYVSADVGGSWHPIRWFAPGYVRGKEKSEAAVSECYGDDGNGVCLRCGMISGTRYIFGGKIALPLSLFGWFASWVTPVVKRQDVAKAAIRFIKSKEKVKDTIVPNRLISSFMA